MGRDVFGNWVTTDPFGRKIPKRQLQRERLDENKRKGRVGEDEIRMIYALNGYRVERTGRGHDFVVTRDDIFSGRWERLHIEVKTGGGRLSKLQKKTKRKNRNYRVERVDPFFY